MGDPRIDALRAVLAARAPRRIERPHELDEAAVLLVVRTRDPLELLLIKRAELEGDPWSGHMALPGGRRQREDADLLATALRETMEETGVKVRPADVLGQLDELQPGGGIRRFGLLVAPFIGVVRADACAVPDPAEVDEALWLPLPQLAHEDAVSEVLIELEDGARRFPSLNYREYVIWGLTHRILAQFLELVRDAGLQR